jgi:hypothetical protein
VNGEAPSSDRRFAAAHIRPERDRAQRDRDAGTLDKREVLVIERQTQSDRDDRIERTDQTGRDRRETIDAAKPTRVRERRSDQSEIRVAADRHRREMR